MKFYKLDYPDYESDTMHSRKNPVAWVNQFVVPGMICPLCGAWAGNRRLFFPIEDTKLEGLLKKKPSPIHLDEWNKLFNNPVNNFNIASGFRFVPGDELGKPTGKITTNRVPDFIFPWRGGILVTEKTKNIIVESKLTGCQFSRMDLIDKRGKKEPAHLLPVIYVLIVTGRIKQPINVDRCPVCDRFKSTYSIELNEGSWDGNDFMIDENYPNLFFVTERVCAIFKEKDLKNYQCKPVWREKESVAF